jgi:hypothetical protein
MKDFWIIDINANEDNNLRRIWVENKAISMQ